MHCITVCQDDEDIELQAAATLSVVVFITSFFFSMKVEKSVRKRA